ncbi:MAG: DUF4198 domain-containing protein [Oscillospiraceae bacterium]|nr:DUF4198 domain-containing protein [Oscillospiraceae bacterium]
MLKTKLKVCLVALMCMVLLIATVITSHGHGLFVLTAPESAEGHEFGSAFPGGAKVHAEIGETVVVTGGWGYNFLGPDGAVHTGFYHRVTLIAPNGGSSVLEHSWFHQRDGRDNHDAPIRIVPFSQIGTGAFPSGGRHNVFLQSTFVPQSEGYYQIVFERFRAAGNFATAGHENYGLLIVDTVHTVVMVGDPAATADTGFARPSGTGRLTIIPTNDVGRLSHDDYEYMEGILLLDGVPVPNQRIRVNIPGLGILDGSGGHNAWLTPDDFSTDANGGFRVPIPRLGPTSPGFYSIQVPAFQVTGTAGTLRATDGSVVYGYVTRGVGDEAVTTHERINYTRINEVFLYHFFLPAGEYRTEAPPARPVDRPDAPPSVDNNGGGTGTPTPPPLPPVDGVDIDLPNLFTIGNIIGFVGGGVMLLAAGVFIGLGLAKKK